VIKKKILYAFAGVLSVVAVTIIGFTAGRTIPPFINGSTSLKDTLKDSVSTKNLPKFYVVQSGSMEPAIPVASVVVSTPRLNYKRGDVVTYKKGENSETVITHRIQAKLYPQGVNEEPVFLTAGDANEDFDRGEVTKDQIIGKVTLTVPYLGYVVDFAKKPHGFILLVVVPATIIIYEELKNLIFESKKQLTKRLKKGVTDPVSRKLGDGKKGKKAFELPKAAAIIPIFGAGIVLIGLSAAYFFDHEVSLGNILSAAEDFNSSPTPSPQSGGAATLVMNEFLWNSSCTPNPEKNAWIELFNGSSVEVDLKDWQFRDGNGAEIQISNAEFTLQPNEYVLIVINNSVFSNCYENTGDVRVLNLGGNIDFLPETTNGIIYLEKPVDDSFETVDTIEYGPDRNCGNLNTALDQSVQRTPNAHDTAMGSSFNAGDFGVTDSLTPGLPNTSTTAVSPCVSLINSNADPQYGYVHDYSGANVTFTYQSPSSGILSGTIAANGLKPYATYQLKFEGTPTCQDSSGDDAMNEVIGYKGRWWDNTDNQNLNSDPASNDAFYLANSIYHGGSHCITGYLVWDFVTADSSGNASKSVSTANSYHVLWCGGGTCDINTNDYLYNPDSAHTDVDFCPADKVDGEIERFSCGGLTLNPGNYDLRIILNEESFHQGNWTAVMDGNINFEIQ
jgi:signal peptidase I